MFTGSCVAIVTPMDGDEVDLNSLTKLVDWHIESGTSALVAAGTTGEACTLNDKETRLVLETVVRQVKGRIPVIAGTGCNSTQRTIERTQVAKDSGCDAALIITPYYNKPMQAGLLAHYQAIHDGVNLPFLLYNNPSRTACDMSVQTTATLSELPQVIGIKDATGDLLRLEGLKKVCDDSFLFLSGDDNTALEYIRQGGQGVISTVGNIVPQLNSQMCKAALKGDFSSAEEVNQKLQPLYRMMGIESNPIPVKWALEKMGRIKSGIRLPLTPLSIENQEIFKIILEKEVGVSHA